MTSQTASVIDAYRHGDGDPARAAILAGREVIGPTGAVRVMVATKPVDFRKGAEGLAALVRETVHCDPFDGVIYVFRAKPADRIKLVFWDGTVCLFAKRLEDGEFRWPKIEDGAMRLSAAQFSAISLIRASSSAYARASPWRARPRR
jgi:transposase